MKCSVQYDATHHFGYVVMFTATTPSGERWRYQPVPANALPEYPTDEQLLGWRLDAITAYEIRWPPKQLELPLKFE